MSWAAHLHCWLQPELCNLLSMWQEQPAPLKAEDIKEGDGADTPPPLPCFPAYTGLTYTPAADTPASVAEDASASAAIESPPAWVALPKPLESL